MRQDSDSTTTERSSSVTSLLKIVIQFLVVKILYDSQYLSVRLSATLRVKRAFLGCYLKLSPDLFAQIPPIIHEHLFYTSFVGLQISFFDILLPIYSPYELLTLQGSYNRNLT